MTATAARAISVDLGIGHHGPDCLEMSWQLHRQLSDGYTHRASTMPVPDSFDQYLSDHRTTRKRAGRAARLGYRFAEIDRREYEDDVFAVNTSAADRQGRPMSAGYRERPHFSSNPLRCDRHHVYTYGVLTGARLVAYLWLYRAGELAMVSSILGHREFEDDGIMFLLFSETVREQIEFGGTMFYNLHSSGTDGLRDFKERLGFAETSVEWRL